MVRTHSRPTGSTHRNLSHLSTKKRIEYYATLTMWNLCKPGQNTIICLQVAQIQAAPTAPPALRWIEDITPYESVLNDVNAASNHFTVHVDVDSRLQYICYFYFDAIPS